MKIWVETIIREKKKQDWQVEVCSVLLYVNSVREVGRSNYLGGNLESTGDTICV